MNTIFKESLSDYDGPGLFIVQKGLDLYISIKILHEEDYKYIVVPVTPQQIKEAKRAKISVDTIFMGSPIWYIGNFAPSGFVLSKQNSSITQLASYFDGTFYLDPEDYEDELTLDKLFSKNDFHILTVWKEEDLKTEKINSTPISPLVKFNKDINKDINRDIELNFSCDCSCFIEMQNLEDYAA